MKRRNRFLTVLLSAAFSFSILTAALGTEHWKRGHYWHHGHHWHHHHHDCEQDDQPATEPEKSLES